MFHVERYDKLSIYQTATSLSILRGAKIKFDLILLITDYYDTVQIDLSNCNHKNIILKTFIELFIRNKNRSYYIRLFLFNIHIYRELFVIIYNNKLKLDKVKI